MEKYLADVTFAVVDGGRAVPVVLKLAAPRNRDGWNWLVDVELTVGGDVEHREAHGADPLQALLNGLIDAAVIVNELRSRGRISYHGRNDDYFCLDELLRTPETNGYLPTGIDRETAGR